MILPYAIMVINIISDLFGDIIGDLRVVFTAFSDIINITQANKFLKRSL